MSTIGIDRIVLTDLNIQQIDKELLKEKGFVVIDTNKENIRLIKDKKELDLVPINYIKVNKSDENSLIINELVIGRKTIESNVLNYIDYEILDATLPAIISKTGTNEKNISNWKEFKKVIAAIEEELKGLGFGQIDLLQAEVRAIELNHNIAIQKPFKEYYRALEYIRQLLPHRLKTKINDCYYNEQGEYTGFKVGNNSVTLKVYNKRLAIKKKKGHDIGEELLRIEYSLNSKRKVRDTFGTAALKNIVSNNLEPIEKAFKSFIEGDIVNSLYKDIEKKKKAITKELERPKGKGANYIINLTNSYQDDLLDIGLVLDRFKADKTISKNYARESRKAIATARELKEQGKLFGNITNLNEILTSLNFKPIEINTTPTIKKELQQAEREIQGL